MLRYHGRRCSSRSHVHLRLISAGTWLFGGGSSPFLSFESEGLAAADEIVGDSQKELTNVELENPGQCEIIIEQVDDHILKKI